MAFQGIPSKLVGSGKMFEITLGTSEESYLNNLVDSRQLFRHFLHLPQNNTKAAISHSQAFRKAR